MFGGVLCLIVLITFWNLKKNCLFYILIHMFGFMCFRSSHQQLFYEIDNRKRYSAKPLWKSLTLIKLLYAYSSTKDKLLLKYFIRKIIWKNTSNSSFLLVVFLNIVIRRYFCFLWLCSKELAVTLKCYSEKK